jgi:SagB-type dehydrogenase family enzyme
MSSLKAWVDLGNPRPREQVEEFDPVVWPPGEPIALPFIEGSVADGAAPSFREIALRRRSRRTFAGLRREALSQLLEITCRTQRVRDFAAGLQLSQRPVPSSGAIHPIHMLILEPTATSMMRYEPIGHALVPVDSGVDLNAVRATVGQVLDPQDGTILFLAAEPNRTAAKYKASASLVWRDAGALIGALALGAESLGLACCPLGITGEPFVSALVDQAPLVGVGVILLGSACD